MKGTATCNLQDHLVPNGFELGQTTILDAACEDSFNSSPKVSDVLPVNKLLMLMLSRSVC